MKTDLINALAQTPKTIFPAIVGQIESFAKPDNKDAAAIACGMLAWNINEHLLKPMSGLDLSELILRSGQKNSTLISILLAGLEAISGSGGKLTVISPTEGAKVPTWFEAGFVCKGESIESAEVSVDGSVLSLAADGDQWKATLTTPLSIGKHTATFTATYGDGSTTDKTVEFEATANMELVSTFPANETSYRPAEVTRIEVVLSDDAAAVTDSVSVDVFGQVYNLAKSGATFACDVASIAADWWGMNIMTVYDASQKVLGEVSFLLTGEES